MPDYTPDNIEPEYVSGLLEEANRMCDCIGVVVGMLQRQAVRLEFARDIIARHFADPEPQEPGLDPAGEDGGLTWRISP